MENSVRHLMFSASSPTTALAIAVPSNVAVPRPGVKWKSSVIPKNQEAKQPDVYLLLKRPPRLLRWSRGKAVVPKDLQMQFTDVLQANTQQTLFHAARVGGKKQQ